MKYLHDNDFKVLTHLACEAVLPHPSKSVDFGSRLLS